MLRLKKRNLYHELAELITDVKTIVEGGTFHAHDTIQMARTWPESTIYTFEPVEELFTGVIDNTQAYPNIRPIHAALAEKNGTALFWPSENPDKPGKHSQAGSLLKPKERLKHSKIRFNEPIEVTTISLDSWVKQHDIAAIDLLWLDLQGYELPALQGAINILPHIRFIYTEVCFIEAYEHQNQYPQVVQWLSERGFEVIGKDFDDVNDWFFGNILCKNRMLF